MGFFRIISRPDRQLHLSIQQSVKKLVKDVEADLDMLSRIPDWKPIPIRVRQIKTLDTIKRDHGSEAHEKVKKILDRRIPKLEKLWDLVTARRQEILASSLLTEDDPDLMVDV